MSVYSTGWQSLPADNCSLIRRDSVHMQEHMQSICIVPAIEFVTFSVLFCIIDRIFLRLHMLRPQQFGRIPQQNVRANQTKCADNPNNMGGTIHVTSCFC